MHFIRRCLACSAIAFVCVFSESAALIAQEIVVPAGPPLVPSVQPAAPLQDSSVPAPLRGARRDDSGSAPSVQAAPQTKKPDSAGKNSSAANPSSNGPRRSAKPVVEGQTFIELDQVLTSVYNGRAPQTLEELKALESQQSKVAAAIQKVTVNVRQGAAQGSGVLIGNNYVLTAAHVGGKPGRTATVVLSDGTELKAEVLGMNRDVDAGLLKIVDTRGKELSYATLGKSSQLRTGQWVIGCGHPGGWQSGRGGVIRVGRVLNIMSDTLITDVALIGGDSGGPLFNLRGELIGIHSRIGTDVVDNMHVPIDTFAKDWERLKEGKAWGVLPGYRPVIGVGAKQGEKQAVVGDVTHDGPAYRAGVKEGDIVQKFDGQTINTFEDLQSAVLATLPGDAVKIEVRRGNETMRMMIVVGVAEQ